jgi:hypothetical protein
MSVTSPPSVAFAPSAMRRRRISRKAWHPHARHLEWVQNRVRPDLDERMAEAGLLAFERYPRVEDAFVERDQPIHVGSEERM